MPLSRQFTFTHDKVRIIVDFITIHISNTSNSSRLIINPDSI